jgi:DNA anti-recombination protein RmuC
MQRDNTPKPLKHFLSHLFVVGRVHNERNRSKIEVDRHLDMMRKSIIRMNLTYSDLDNLREKINNYLHWEAKYAKYFRPADKDTQEIKDKLEHVRKELRLEKEEKKRMKFDLEDERKKLKLENSKKLKDLKKAMSGIRIKMNQIIIEKAKKQKRLNYLDKKIDQRLENLHT